MHLCSDCAVDPFLKSSIEARGEPGCCSGCETNQRSTFDVRTFADYLAPIITSHFVPWPAVYDRYEHLGLTLVDVVRTIAREEPEELIEAIAADLVSHLGEAEGLFEECLTYRQRPRPLYQSISMWTNVSFSIKNKQRYFSHDALTLFDRLFENVETMSAVGRPPHYFPEVTVVCNMQKGRSIFRARKLPAHIHSVEAYVADPLTEIGAPPARCATAGRMNATGVCLFYGAEDQHTCFAEVRPSIGERVVIGRFQALRDLRILDFSKLRNVFLSAPSLLDPQYSEKVRIQTLLEELSTQIALPVLVGQEDDYLITQAMAEYLAHVRKPPFDGIIFESVQRAGGRNIVLFSSGASGTEAGFPIGWAGDAPIFWETRAVEYSKEEISYGTEDGFFALPPPKDSAEWHSSIFGRDGVE